MMWPFSCKNCSHLEERLNSMQDDLKHFVNKTLELRKLSQLEWTPLDGIMPPIKTNLLVANKDFTYFGFLYMEDGWDYSRKINMFGKGLIWATYTNAESISWWLNLDLIKKEI